MPLHSDKMNRSLKYAAHNLGMRFFEKDEKGLLPFLNHFRLFKVGHSKAIVNLMHKKDEWMISDINIFDYRYKITVNKSVKTYWQTVFFINSKELGLPDFYMKPEHFLHKAAAFLGWEDINFEAYPKFSKQYYLKGEDEYYIRAVMSDEVLKLFTIEKEWHLEAVNYFLILYKRNQLLRGEQIKDFYEKGMKICEMLKQNPLK